MPLSMVIEILGEVNISSDEMSNEEIARLLPTIHCEKVDLYAAIEDCGTVYIPDYKAPTTMIEIDEGDVANDFYE